MHAVSAAEFLAEVTADIVVNTYIPLLRCPVCLLSDNGLQLCSKLSHAICKLHGMQKLGQDPIVLTATAARAGESCHGPDAWYGRQ